MLALSVPQVVNFMRQLADNQPTAEAFLGTLGAGNWGGPSKGGAKDGDDGGLLQRYLSTSHCSPLRVHVLLCELQS